MSEKIILYDIKTGQTPPAWSSNSAKTRLLLNYLEIPFETEWLSFPDVTPFLRGKPGLVERKVPQEAIAPYTVPTINDNGTWVMDSEKILEHVLERFDIPREKIIPNEEFWIVYRDNEERLLLGIFAQVGVTFTHPLFEAGRARDGFYSSKSKLVGRQLDDIRADKKYVSDTWHQFIAELNTLNGVREAIRKSDNLSEDELFKGGYIYGDELSYVDFVVFGMVFWAKVCVSGGGLADVDGLTGENWLSPWYNEWYDKVSVYFKF